MVSSRCNRRLSTIAVGLRMWMEGQMVGLGGAERWLSHGRLGTYLRKSSPQVAMADEHSDRPCASPLTSQQL